MKFERIPSGDLTVALPEAAADLRRFARQKLTAQGSLRFGGRGFTVTMENLSEQGCQFWSPRKEGFPSNAAISLYIEKLGPFPATVRWSREGWVGIEFDRPIYLPVLQHIHDNLDRSA